MRIPAILLASLSISSLQAQLGPEHRFIYPAGATALAIRDLDGDGDGDVLRATTAGLLFQEQVAPDVYRVTQNLGNVDGLGFIHFADLNSDGMEDLLLPLRAPGKVRWAQALGGGDFAAIADLVTGLDRAFNARAADLDGDLDLDLVYVHDSADVKISWSENTGGMSYGPSQLILATGIVVNFSYPVFDNFFDLADLDGDTDMDLAIANSGLRWFENDGSGAFTTHTLPGTPPDQHVLLADIDGDLDVDILFGGQGNDLYRTLNDGAGNFSPFTSALYLPGPSWSFSSWSVLDSEGDGDLDLFFWLHEGIASPDELLRYANDGTGTFTLAGTLMGADYAQPYAVGYADGDAIADVLGFANDGLQLHLTAGGGLQRLNSGGNPFFLAGYGTDIFICSPTGWSPLAEGPRPLQLGRHVNLGGGDIQEEPIEYWVSDAAIWRADVADLDGMGGPDLLLAWSHPVGGSATNDFIMSGTDSLTSVGDTHYSNLVGPVVPRIRDLDLDGDNDVVRYYGGPIHINLNNGNGYFAPEQDHSIGGMYIPTGVTLCKVDGDGYPDFVWCHYEMTGSDSVLWNLNDGTGAPQPTAVAMVAPMGIFPEPDIRSPVLATHDLDQDGMEDVIIFTGDSIAFMRNTGGAFTALQEMACSAIAYAVGDMDGGGYPDIVALLQNGDLAAWINLGNGSMGGMLILATAAQHTGRDHLILRDLSGDGALDVVTCAVSGSAAWLENLFNSPYRAEGLVWHDVNADGVHDAGEGPLPFVLAQCDPPYGYPMTDTSGVYTFALGPGNFVLSSLVPDTLWTLTTDSIQYHVALTPLDPVSTGNDFGYTPSVIVTNLEPVLVGSTGLCDHYTNFFVQATNLGTTTPEGHFALVLDTAFAFSAAYPAPDSVVGQTVHWSFDELYYYSTYGVHLTVQGPPLALLDSAVTNTLTLEAIIGGIVVQTTTALWTDTVTCSWDPNDKQVSPVGIGEYGVIDIATDHLDYTIRFQNTGTAPATDVILRDALDVDLDPTSLTLLGYSHTPSEVRIRPDGTLEFHFDGINLPDSGADFQASQGFVKFRVSLDNGLPHLTTIENNAAIHFDLNPPVITNTTLNTLVDCSLHEATVVSIAPDLLEATAGASYQWYLNGVELPGATGQTLSVWANGDYTVQVTSIYGCVDVSDAFTYVNDGIVETAHFTMRIVPNPMSDLATVYFSEALTTDHRIELLDVNGRVLRSLKANGRSLTVHRDGLGAGIYLLRIANPGGKIASQRLVLR